MTETTAVGEPAPPADGGAATSFGDKVRFVLRGFGQTMITLGFVVLLFVVYEVWITNIFAEREQSKVSHALIKEWRHENRLALPGDSTQTVPIGKGLGVLYLPRLGRDFHFTIVQGSEVPNDSELEKGPAHYKNTALPGQVGYFAVAGHRVGKGEPFLNIDKLRSGDAVVVETRRYWYVYRVLGSPAGRNPQNVRASVTTDGKVSLPGREIVVPSAGEVLLPVPDHEGVQPTERLMTMTTCHPKFTASHRMIVYSKLVTRVPNTAALTMPPAISALYNEVSG
jgi:sortase A